MNGKLIMNKRIKWLLLLCLLQLRLSAWAQADTILVTGKAATLITCRSPVKVMQIESEHPWYNTQLLGKVVMIRAIGIPPIATSAVIITAKRVYPVVVIYDPAMAQGTLQYRIPAKRKSNHGNSTSISWQQLLAIADKSAENTFDRPDTLGVARIAGNFLSDPGKLHAKVRHYKVVAGFVRGMKLKNLFYLHLGLSGKSVVPAEVEAVRVLKQNIRSKALEGMPLLYQTGSTVVQQRRKATIGVVIPATMLHEEAIWVAIKLRNIPPPLIVKIRRRNLPAYMLEPDFV